MLYFITGNKNKFNETKAILDVKIERLDTDLPEIQDIDPKNVISAKIEEAQRNKKGEFIVEDTSLTLDCLNGLPGPFIKRLMITIGNDGLYKIAEDFGNNMAEAKDTIGYSNKYGKIHFFDGMIRGKIVTPRGDNNFGWDPIFQPVGYNKTFAEMTDEEKNKISHRKIALEKLKRFLEKR